MKKVLKIYILLAIVFSLNLLSQDGNKLVSVKYHFEKNEILPGDSIRVIAEITPEKGWHVYWRNPGDAGLATNIEAIFPIGLSVNKIQWEYPEIQPSENVINFGYSKKFYLLFTIYTPKNFDKNNFSFILKSSWLVCKEKCVSGMKIDTFSVNKFNKSTNWNKRLNIVLNKIPKSTFSNYFKAFRTENSVTLKWNNEIKLPSIIRIFPVDEGIYKYKEKYNTKKVDGINQVSLELDPLRIENPNKIHYVIVPLNKNEKINGNSSIEIELDFNN
jgi:DsbC/DsbD-like thiol-disulfide interchange protein